MPGTSEVPGIWRKKAGIHASPKSRGGGPPSPEQMAELQALQNKLSQGALWTAVLLPISVVGMALSH